MPTGGFLVPKPRDRQEGEAGETCHPLGSGVSLPPTRKAKEGPVGTRGWRPVPSQWGRHTSGNRVWIWAARPPGCFSRAPPGHSRNQPEQVSLERYIVAEKREVSHPRAGLKYTNWLGHLMVWSMAPSRKVDN